MVETATTSIGILEAKTLYEIIKEFQELVAGVFALIAAGIAYGAVRYQVHQDKKSSVKNRCAV